MAHAKRIQVGLGKENRWASRPTPGSHKWKSSIAVVTALRDVLGLVGNAKEAKKVMVDGLLLVDGVVEKNHKRGLGLMDVLELPRLKKSYRVVPTKKGLEIIEIDSKDSKVKLCRVVGKRTVSGGRTQLSFHDGTTVLDEKKEFKVNDTAVLSLPDRKVKKRIAFGEGVLGVVSHGLHSGYQGKIAKVLPAIASRKSLATIGDIQTLTEYVFAVGDGKPEVTLA